VLLTALIETIHKRARSITLLRVCVSPTIPACESHLVNLRFISFLRSTIPCEPLKALSLLLSILLILSSGPLSIKII
jgi:hypothetical protein